jgi:hypothetical protein
MKEIPLQTTVPATAYPFAIDHQTPCLCLGSCFVEHIGSYLTDHHFPVCFNPFGIVYQPAALAAVLERIVDGRPYEANELFCVQDVWRHFDFHSRYAHPDRAVALDIINQQLAAAHAFLRQAKVLILTLGTATTYTLVPEGRVVVNCHKQPGSRFERRRYSPAENVALLQAAIARVRSLQPELQIIFSLSPVRHLREGLPENQRSKASLLLTIDSLCTQLEDVHYFPSYEIMLDELRDYRYYDTDLSHPSPLAVRLICERFARAFFSEKTQQLCGQLAGLRAALAHRPFFPQTPAHQQFVMQQLQKLHALREKYPFLQLTSEENILYSQLISKP